MDKEHNSLSLNEFSMKEIKLDEIMVLEEGIQPGGLLCGLGCISAGVYCGLGCPK